MNHSADATTQRKHAIRGWNEVPGNWVIALMMVHHHGRWKQQQQQPEARELIIGHQEEEKNESWRGGALGWFLLSERQLEQCGFFTGMWTQKGMDPTGYSLFEEKSMNLDPCIDKSSINGEKQSNTLWKLRPPKRFTSNKPVRPIQILIEHPLKGGLFLPDGVHPLVMFIVVRFQDLFFHFFISWGFRRKNGHCPRADEV